MTAAHCPTWIGGDGWVVGATAVDSLCRRALPRPGAPLSLSPSGRLSATWTRHARGGDLPLLRPHDHYQRERRHTGLRTESFASLRVWKEHRGLASTAWASNLAYTVAQAQRRRETGLDDLEDGVGDQVVDVGVDLKLL
jgi:hypothetical protein